MRSGLAGNGDSTWLGGCSKGNHVCETTWKDVELRPMFAPESSGEAKEYSMTRSRLCFWLHEGSSEIRNLLNPSSCFSAESSAALASRPLTFISRPVRRSLFF